MLRTVSALCSRFLVVDEGAVFAVLLLSVFAALLFAAW